MGAVAAVGKHFAGCGHLYTTVGKHFTGFGHSGAVVGDHFMDYVRLGAVVGDSNGNRRPSGAVVGKHWSDSGGRIAPLLFYFVNSRRTFAPVEAFNGA